MPKSPDSFRGKFGRLGKACYWVRELVEEEEVEEEEEEGGGGGGRAEGGEE